jgi:hypothetical protein
MRAACLVVVLCTIFTFGCAPESTWLEQVTVAAAKTAAKYETQPPAPNYRRRNIVAASGNLYLYTGAGHWIKDNIDSGRFIQLEDKSFWEVSTFDRMTSSLWLPISDIVVVEGDDLYYPYLLINTDDGEKVEAKLISR